LCPTWDQKTDDRTLQPPAERGCRGEESGYHRCREIHATRSKFASLPMGRGECYCSLPIVSIVVGYLEVSKAYRIYIPSLRRVVVSKDVRFEEDRAFQRSLESIVSVEDDA
jgi:hypothetical protein